MKRRPALLVLLAWVHGLAPLLSFVLALTSQSIPSGQHWAFLSFFPLSMWLEAFVLFPLAGLAIYTVKSWGLTLFLGVMGWILYLNVHAHYELPQAVSLSRILFVIGLDILITGYLLSKNIRELYFKPEKRWWESKPRYSANVPCRIEYEGQKKELSGEIKDISMGGALIVVHGNVPGDKSFYVRFVLNREEFYSRVDIVHSRKLSENKYGVGARWNGLTLPSLVKLKLIITNLNRRGMRAPRDERLSFWQMLRLEIAAISDHLANQLKECPDRIRRFWKR